MIFEEKGHKYKFKKSVIKILVYWKSPGIFDSCDEFSHHLGNMEVLRSQEFFVGRGN